MSSGQAGATKPRVLFVYYTHTQQALRVVEAMTEALADRGFDVTQAGIEFTDSRYREKFATFPFKHAVFDILPLAMPQLRQKTGEIQIPEAARDGDYDLVVIGSPTWFFRTCMPLRSYLETEEAGKILAGKPFGAFVVCRRYWNWNLKEVRKRGTGKGGTYLDGTHFTYEGGQIRSLLSLLSYFGKGENRPRYLGIKIPPTNLKPDFTEQAQRFANQLADGLEPPSPAPAGDDVS
jgi:flavodoxin